MQGQRSQQDTEENQVKRMEFRHGDPALAKQYLAEFEANSPSPDARGVMEQMKLAERIDAALAGDPSTTTTPGATATTTTSPPG